MTEFKPGVVYDVGVPEFIGRMPVHSELSSITPDTGPNFTDKELAEHGSLVLRVFQGIDDPRDNRVTSDCILTVDGSVLVRAKAGGWYNTSLEKDHKGWFVRVSESRHRLDVSLDYKRGCYVVRETI